MASRDTIIPGLRVELNNFRTVLWYALLWSFDTQARSSIPMIRIKKQTKKQQQLKHE